MTTIGKTPNEILREVLAKKTSGANATSFQQPQQGEAAEPGPAAALQAAPVAEGELAAPVVSQVGVESASATVFTETNVSGTPESLTEEQLLPFSKAFDKKTPISYVTVKTGMTINLGNYSNGKIDVSISVPVGFEITQEYQKKINEAYEFAKSFTETKTREQARKLISYAKSKQA